MKEKIFKILFEYILPIVCLFFIILINAAKLYSDVLFGILGSLFAIWLIGVIYFIIKWATNKLHLNTIIQVIWPLVSSLFFLICCGVVAFEGNVLISNVCYVTSIILLELYLVYLIFCCAYKKNISVILMLSLLFIIIGYYTIYELTFSIEDKTLFNSLISLFSSIIGGGLTLGGVAWTIMHEKESRKYDEKLKIKPVIFVKKSSVNDYLSDRIFNNKNIIKKMKIVNGINNYGTLKEAKDKKGNYIFSPIYIVNSDYSYIAIRGFRINDDYHIYDIGQVINKNEEVILRDEYHFKYNKKINYVSLLIQDIQNNYYEMEVNYNISPFKEENYIEIISCIEIKESNLDLKDF